MTAFLSLDLARDRKQLNLCGTEGADRSNEMIFVAFTPQALTL